MARYLYCRCPRCSGYGRLVMREPERALPLQAVNGHCLRCSYRLAWIVVRGNSQSKRKHLASPYPPSSKNPCAANPLVNARSFGRRLLFYPQVRYTAPVGEKVIVKDSRTESKVVTKSLTRLGRFALAKDRYGRRETHEADQCS